MIQHWDESYDKGKKGEAEIDEMMSPWFDIKEATESQDRLGTDRFLMPKAFGHCRIRAQYKTDWRAHYSEFDDNENKGTGNFFIEVVSVDGPANKPGWSLKCDAEWLCYWIPVEQVLYILHVRLIRIFVPIWYMENFPIHQSENAGYETHGICVPRRYVEKFNPSVILRTECVRDRRLANA